MPDDVSVPAPNATEPAATAEPTAPAEEEKPPSPEEALEKHVAHALKAGKRKEAAAKGKATKEAKSVAPPKTEAAPPAAEPEPEAEPEDKPSRSGKSHRQLLEEGDIDGAFEAAFGKKPQDFGINSKRWAEYRQVVAKDKRAIAQREQNLVNTIERVKAEVAPLLPLRDAREAYARGDFEAALKLAFGDDTTTFNKKLIGRLQHSANPEVEATRAELRQLKEELLRERQEYAQQIEAQRVESARQEYVATVSNEIAASDDPELSAFAKKPRFIGRVFQILQQHYDLRTDTTLPILEAADMARQEIVGEYGDVFRPRDAVGTAVSVRGGSNPAKPVSQGTRTLSQQGAAETSAPPSGWHGKSLDDQIREFEIANGLKTAARR